MLLLPLFKHYALWHYTTAFGEILHIYRNLTWFAVHFFSMSTLAKTLFAPFKRMTEHRSRGFSLEDLAGYVIINLISRLVGFILRSIVLLLGIGTVLGLGLGLVLTYVIWVTAPIVLFGSFLYGFILVFSL